MTLIHHAFELRLGSSHPSVVILNRTSPSLPLEKIVVSDDLGPDLLAGVDSGGVFVWVLPEPFILNSSCHDFKKLTKDKKWAVNCGYIWRNI